MTIHELYYMLKLVIQTGVYYLIRSAPVLHSRLFLLQFMNLCMVPKIKIGLKSKLQAN